MSLFRWFLSVRFVFVLPLFLLFSCGGGDDSSTSSGASSLTITWASFPSSGILDSLSEALPDPVISPAPASVTIAHKAGDCTWDNEAKRISFEGLGNCILTVTANKQGFPEKTQDFTVNIVGRFTSISWDFPNTATSGVSKIFREYPEAVPAADNVEIVVKSGSCTWTHSTKTLAFTGNEKCVVTVTAKKAGYEDLPREFSVDPSLQAIDITGWGTYGSVLTDGVAVDAPALTGSDNDATKVYTSTTSHLCTVAPDTGAVTGIQSGNCGISLTLSKTGHNDNTHIYNIVVTGLFTSILWEAFPSAAVQGTPTSALSSPVSSPPADDYTITRKSGGCAWDDNTNILSFSGTVECILTVTAAKSGYQSKSEDFSVTAVGTISATAGSYGEAFFIGRAVSSPLTGLDPQDADRAYISADDDICTVDNSTGTVTGVDEGECRITLTLSKTGYNDKTIEYMLPVALSPEDF